MQLENLAKACQPATFGRNQQDVYDESYRKAGKMDVANFATNLSPLHLGMIDTVHDTLLRGQHSGKMIRYELYKLNVYGKPSQLFTFWHARLLSFLNLGPGAFFKAHVDTPRTEAMFGSLVVVFPTIHEGGSLLFKHGGKEWSFESAKTASTSSNPQAAFVAFFSDVEHEVSPVIDGYRVTLTYNLYFDESKSLPVVVSPGSRADEEAKMALVRLLDDPDFLPDGGLLGFGLTHKYALSITTDLSALENKLKATDAAFKRLCTALSLPISLKVAYQDDLYGEYDYCLGDEFIDLEYSGECDGGIAGVLVELKKGVLVMDAQKTMANGLSIGDFGDPQSKPIAWAKPILQMTNGVKTPYVAYGNQACLDSNYGDVCLVAEIPSAIHRKAQRP